jgi:hypothetical protein
MNNRDRLALTEMMRAKYANHVSEVKNAFDNRSNKKQENDNTSDKKSDPDNPQTGSTNDW